MCLFIVKDGEGHEESCEKSGDGGESEANNDWSEAGEYWHKVRKIE